ncbi:MAG TPA: ribosome maturation factor RimP [Marmoricola sp.]|nr:ribosome maturation factor RimP [Marmoricola sp.]
MSAPGTPDITDRLTGLLAGPVEALGLDLEAVDLSRAGKRSVLRIAVDKDGGVDMDDIAAATAEVSRVLDDSDVMGNQSYTLEVSSPGVDRPLTHPRHWRRNTGRLVKATLAEGEEVTGRIVDTDDSGADVDVEGTVRRLAYADVSKARIQIEFKREA